MIGMDRGFLIAISLAAALPAHAQWLDLKTPDIPRMQDGKPNLAAPAPRTADGKPDLSGLWALSAGPGNTANVAASLGSKDIQPWADEVYKRRLGDFGKDDPWTAQCLPAGPREILSGGGGPARILQTPKVIAILYEDLTYRQIFLDGRALPKDPNPAFMGYSTGHWDGDTLVVESTGFNDRTWLDMGGHPHTESLRTTERYRRTNFGHMDVQVTFEDPKAYNKPWTISYAVNFAPDTEMLESVCAENERDRSHLVGRTSSERAVVVSRETLAKYVGVYRTVRVTGSGMSAPTFTVSLEGDQLMLQIGNNGKLPMVPLSQTTFSPRLLGTYEFRADVNGDFTQLVAFSTEGDIFAEKRK
jgi:hypothetical protein